MIYEVDLERVTYGEITMQNSDGIPWCIDAYFQVCIFLNLYRSGDCYICVVPIKDLKESTLMFSIVSHHA